MKKLITIISILASISSLNAQTTFAPLGAEWYYRGNTYQGWPYGHEFIERYSCIGENNDSLYRYATIQVVKKSQRVSYNNSISGYQFSERYVDTSIITLKIAPDTVFFFNEVFQKYTPLYIFNLAANDSFQIPITDTSTLVYSNTFTNPMGDSLISFVVDTVKNVQYNGHNSTEYVVQNRILKNPTNAGKANYPLYNWTTDYKNDSLQNSWANYTLGSYSRAFGGLSQGLLPAQYYSTFEVIHDGPPFTKSIKFCSYKDTTMSWGNVGNCDVFDINVPLSIRTIESFKDLSIYPNPVINNEIFIKAKIKFAKGTKVRIVDILGNEAIKVQSLDGESEHILNVSKVPSGLYVLIIESEGQQYFQKITKH